MNHLRQVDVIEPHRQPTALQHVPALPADEAERHGPARIFAHELAERLHHVGVEAAGQAAIGRNHDDERRSVRSAGAALEQRMLRLIDPRGDARQHAPGFTGERTGGHDAFLRATQLRRGHHLQGLRDLLRRLHGANAPAHVYE